MGKNTVSVLIQTTHSPLRSGWGVDVPIGSVVPVVRAMTVGCFVSELVAFHCSSSRVVFLCTETLSVCSALLWWLVGCAVLPLLIAGWFVRVLVVQVLMVCALSLCGKDSSFMGGLASCRWSACTRAALTVLF